MSQQSPTTPPTLDQQHCNRAHQSSKHVRFFHWNCGGLSAPKLDELKMWLTNQRIDVAVLSESRWSFTNEWTADGWHHIHSGTETDRGAGLLVLISTSVCHLTDLRWADILPGRLMHVQLRYHNRHVDIMACYQQTFSQHASRLQDRRKWFQMLDQYLGTLAKRHILLMAGDMNCSLPAMQGYVGTATVRWKNKQHLGTQHPDSGTFAALVKAHGLCALNSWSSRVGPTFFHACGVSRIDFFFTRTAVADGTARAVKYLHHAPFLPCTNQGHVPMITQIRRFWIPPVADSQMTGISMKQRELGRQAFLTQDANWQTFMHDSARALSPLLQRAMFTCINDPDSFVTDLHVAARTCYRHSFPAGSNRSSPVPCSVATSMVLNKWKHRALCMQRGKIAVSDRHVFHAWFHLARFQALRRAHQRQAKLIRAQKFQQIMDQASVAASRHDSFALFQVINRFSPKQAKRRMQLRNAAGSLATPVEELAILREFVRTTWQGPLEVPMPLHVPTEMPFSIHDLEKALSTIPLTKAVARPFTPGIIWKAHASLIAPALYNVLQRWWCLPDPWIPQHWRDAWMILIPKPGKRTSAPALLRPLALQEPVGKCIVGILAQSLQRTSYTQIAPLPIWAYIPCRSTQHALNRVAAHTKAGRTLVASQRPTVFHRHQNMQTYKVCGAVQLFLDLERAFDNVDRVELFARLPEIGVHPKVHQLLAGWHRGTRYHVAAAQSSVPELVGSGVRQGCKAAPMLFNAFLFLYLTDLASHIGWTWICEHLDVYADDIHVGALFYNQAELNSTLKNFGIIMEVLKHKGMSINASKSAVLLTMGGTSFRRLRQKLTSRDCTGEWIKIQGLTELFVVPVLKQTKYLGVIVSYGDMEQATMKHRLTLAKVAFARLRTWLTARKGLSLKQRMLMWKTCVVPVLTYGLFTIGLTKPGIHKIQIALISMMRQILHDHPYVTGHSHMQILTHPSAVHPIALLCSAAETLHMSLTQPRQPLLASDIVHTIKWQSLTATIALLRNELIAGVELPGDLMSAEEAQHVTPMQCEWCDFCSPHVSVMRRHCTLVHGFTQFRTSVSNVAQYMVHGLPQCKFCGHSFTTWRSFHIHVQRGCQAVTYADRVTRPLAATPEMPTPDATVTSSDAPMALTQTHLQTIESHEFGPRLLTLIAQRRWTDLLRERAGCMYLAKHCILCSQYVGRAQTMHHHARLTHGITCGLVQAKAIQLTNPHSAETPCAACGVTFCHTHSCNVWYQVALVALHALRARHHLADLLQDPAPLALRCEICDMAFQTEADLHGHLREAHQLASTVWHQARDSWEGQSICRHCSQKFKTMEGLRSHINQGRCKKFNPDSSTEPSPANPMWTPAICQGKLEEVLKVARNRMTLTLHCQCCSRRYGRAIDLAAHLQTSHPQLWKQAQPLACQMVQSSYGQTGCVCNPSCNVIRHQHVCLPYIQLAMHFCRLDNIIYMPHRVTTVDLARVLPTHFPNDLCQNLEQAFTGYNMDRLWTDVLVMDELSNACLWCGCQLMPMELCYHLNEVHHGMNSVVRAYLAQLLPQAMKHSDNDSACFACGQIFNTPCATHLDQPDPHRQKLVQAHLRTQCPTTLHIALLLTWRNFQTKRPNRCSKPSRILLLCWTRA